MRKDTWLQVRIDIDDKDMLAQMAERFELSMSELVRKLIHYLYWNAEMFEFYLEKEEK